MVAKPGDVLAKLDLGVLIFAVERCLEVEFVSLPDRSVMSLAMSCAVTSAMGAPSRSARGGGGCDFGHCSDDTQDTCATTMRRVCLAAIRRREYDLFRWYDPVRIVALRCWVSNASGARAVPPLIRRRSSTALNNTHSTQMPGCGPRTGPSGKHLGQIRSDGLWNRSRHESLIRPASAWMRMRN